MYVVIMQALIYFHHTAENIDITLYMEIHVHTCQEDVVENKEDKVETLFP